MRYWARARRAGFNNNEFYAATLAQVTAVCEVKRDEDREAGRLLALIYSAQINSKRTKESQAVLDPEVVLDSALPPLRGKRSSVIITPEHDPDHGAMGDWRELRSNMVGMTQKARRRQKNG